MTRKLSLKKNSVSARYKLFFFGGGKGGVIARVSAQSFGKMQCAMLHITGKISDCCSFDTSSALLLTTGVNKIQNLSSNKKRNFFLRNAISKPPFVIWFHIIIAIISNFVFVNRKMTLIKNIGENILINPMPYSTI